MKLFLLFSFVLLGASLISPAAYPPPGISRWELLAGAQGIRYWFFPGLSFAWTLLWGLKSRFIVLKMVSAALLCVMCFGVIRDWRISAFKDLQFGEALRRAEAAPSGTAVTIPENPDGWNMRLVMH